jgi:PAS domain S-box-containing protein
MHTSPISDLDELKRIRTIYDELASLRREHRRLRFIADHAIVGIANCSRDHRFTYVNKRYADQQGLTQEEIIGRSVVDVVGEEAYALFKPMMQRVLSGERVEHEVNIPYERHKSRCWVHIVYEPHYDGNTIIGWVATVKDITQRKEAEEALRAEQQQSSLIYANIVDVVFYISVHPNNRFRFESVNAAFLNQTGLVESQVVGKFADEIIPEPSLSLVLEHYRKAIETKQTIKREQIIPYPTGTKTGVISVTPVFNDAGVCNGLVGIINDITERKLAEQSMQRFNERFSVAEAALHGYVHELDVVNDVAWRSQNFTQVLGYEQNEVPLTSKGYDDLIHPDDYPAVQANLAAAYTEHGSRHIKEYRLRHKNGNYIWIRDHSFIQWHDDKPVRIIGTTVDIHDQKILELQLHETSEKLNAMMETLPHIAFTCDATGKATYFNARWTEYSGQNPEEAFGGTSRAYVHPDDLHQVTEWKEHVASGIPFTSQTRYLRKDGQYRWHLIRALPVRNNAGAIAYWIGTCTDIHDQKDFMTKLESLVSERTGELQQSKSILERLNSELSSFAYVAAHDLREPIRKVLAFGDYLVKREGEKLSDRGVDYLTRMQGAARRMDLMLDDLLTFSMVNTWETQRETVELNGVVSQARTTLIDKVEEANATIVVGSLPNYPGFVFQLRQLFIQLIDNALKFSKPDAAPLIEISSEIVIGKNIAGLDAASQYLHITLTDNGIGIDPQYRNRVFDLFQRLHSKDKYSGTGIGLSICRKIVENHQGIITLESKPNIGSTFHIYLPIVNS